MKQYPEGKWTEEARIRVENFTLASAPAERHATGARKRRRDGRTAAAAPPKQPRTRAPPKPRRAKAPAASSAHAAHETGKDPMACSSARSSPAPMRPTSAGRGWTKNIPQLLSGLTPKVSPKKGTSGTLYRLQVAGLSEKHARDDLQNAEGQHPALCADPYLEPGPQAAARIANAAADAACQQPTIRVTRRSACARLTH